MSSFNDNKILLSSVSSLFNLDNEQAAEDLLKATSIKEVKGGDWLMRRGDIGEKMYILLSGRLVALVPDNVGKPIIVGEISKGESVGEMALINKGAKRTADIFAIRDSVLAEISKENFDRLVHQYPDFLLHISQLVVERLQKQLTFQKRPNSFVVFSLFKADNSEAVNHTLDLFIESIASFGQTQVVDANYINQKIGQENIANSDRVEDRQKISMFLNELEAVHDYLLLLADDKNKNWNEHCLRQSDYTLLMLDAEIGTAKRQIEEVFDDYTPENGWNVKLLLVQDQKTELPEHTLKWYENRKVNGHHHVRYDNHKDISRIARIICGKSNGLVLSGGGAKGMAHIGVYKALEEYGIDIDYVCGTSIGSIMAALIAMDKTAEEVYDTCERIFMNNPTPIGDFNLFPYYGILSGKKIDKLLKLVMGDVQIEDLWIPYFCVSSDLTTSSIRLHESGSLWKSVRASISIPGVFPPVIFDNHVLVDGVVFNNIPVDIITKKGVGNVIGINLDTDEIKKVNVSDLPNFFQRTLDRILGRKSYENLPNMMETIAKSTFAMSENQSKDHFKKIDLFFNPPVQQYGLMAWKNYHDITEIGYQHAKKVLDDQKDLRMFRFRI